MLVFNNSNCQLQEAKSVNTLGVFTYSEGQDIAKLEGQCLFFAKDMNEALKFLQQLVQEKSLTRNQTVVIRPFTYFSV